MDWKQFMANVQRNDILMKMIPLEQGMLYPAFSLVNNELCAHFLYHRIRIRKEGLEVWKPQYEAVVLYPQGRVVRVQNLNFHPMFHNRVYDEPKLLPPKSPDEKAVYQKAAEQWQDALTHVLKEAMEPDGEQRNRKLLDEIRVYHQALKELLLPEQYEAYCKLAEIKDE